MSLFVVIGTLTETGVIEDISALFVKLGGNSLFGMYSIIVWGSVIISAFIDNIPYVATMLPVVQGIAAMMGCDAHVLYFGLLVGATLGGNLTPIGASANIAAIGILQKEGYEVKATDFLKIGVPFTPSSPSSPATSTAGSCGHKLRERPVLTAIGFRRMRPATGAEFS